ncbi:MAG: hypothetical protein ACREA9_11810 [Pyrinomonadaceae bacterium]
MTSGKHRGLRLVAIAMSMSALLAGSLYPVNVSSRASEALQPSNGVEDREDLSPDACVTEYSSSQEPRSSGPRPLPTPLETDIPALRCISDDYPSFNGVAIDPENDIVAFSDTNRKSVLIYRRSAGDKSTNETAPAQRIQGPKTLIGFVAGTVLDSVNRELMTVNNDIEDTLMTFPYDAEGNVSPARVLAVPHQSWGIALDKTTDQIAVTVQSLDAVVFYRRLANKVEAPVRSIIGNSTGLADPHGIYVDETNNEIVVASHGNRAEGDVSVGTLGDVPGGRFDPPSINVYTESAAGDAKPMRTIAGAQTQLDWPMGIGIDKSADEIAVANDGDNSILFFKRSASGNVTPSRVIRGSRTGINRPMSVAIDIRNDEIWVANFGDHTALVFERGSKGNLAPKRIIRNAPAGTPSVGFGNPMAIAYDTKRGEILVPN